MAEILAEENVVVPEEEVVSYDDTSVGGETTEDYSEVSNICEKWEDLSSQFISNEDKIAAFDEVDISGIPTEINQSVGVFDKEDPLLTQPKNTPESLEDPVAGQDTIYKELPRPTLSSNPVDVDTMIHEEVYEGEYGDVANQGLGADMLGQAETVTSEVTDVYQGDDADPNTVVGEVVEGEESYTTVEEEEVSEEITTDEEDETMENLKDNINSAVATENDEEETVETPEELVETVEEADEVSEETSKDEEEVETYSEEEVVVEEETMEEEVTEVGEEEVTGDVTTEEGDITTGTVEYDETYGAAIVIDGLPDDLREEIESIELVDNANTKMFDDISFMRDPEYVENDVDPATDGAETVAELVTDGVGLQEGFDGQSVPTTGGALEGGEEIETYDEDTTVEEVVATESLANDGYAFPRISGSGVNARNVLTKFWGAK